MSDRTCEFVNVGKAPPPSVGNIEVKLDLPVYLVDSLGAIAEQLAAIRGEITAASIIKPVIEPIINFSPSNIVQPAEVNPTPLVVHNKSDISLKIPVSFMTLSLLSPFLWAVLTYLALKVW